MQGFRSSAMFRVQTVIRERWRVTPHAERVGGEGSGLTGARATSVLECWEFANLLRFRREGSGYQLFHEGCNTTTSQLGHVLPYRQLRSSVNIWLTCRDLPLHYDAHNYTELPDNEHRSCHTSTYTSIEMRSNNLTGTAEKLLQSPVIWVHVIKMHSAHSLRSPSATCYKGWILVN